MKDVTMRAGWRINVCVWLYFSSWITYAGLKVSGYRVAFCYIARPAVLGVLY